jgi:arylsulfate sulfotransferase
MRSKYIFLLLVCLSLGCTKQKSLGDPENEATGHFSQAEIVSQTIKINPSGYAPLTALIKITTSIPVKAYLRVAGKNGAASDIKKEFNDLSTYKEIPVLGLYPGYANTIELTLYDSKDKNLGTSSVKLITKALDENLPSITINANTQEKTPGMTLESYFGNNGKIRPLLPFIFDEFGDIRWYLDYTTHPELNSLDYDNGIEVLRNGNLYFGAISSAGIYEINMFGDIIHKWTFPGYIFHHKVQEKPNGNFLVSVSKEGLPTIEDFIIEIDRNSNSIINTWDLRQSLEYDRKVFTTNPKDWLHVNAVAYDSIDNTILVSGRTQCVVKLDQNNQVVWILGPHREWGKAGDGTDLNTKLLTPLDRNGQKITDTAVLNGTQNHPDFEWNWCQHAIKQLPNGNYSLFDNGDQRNYSGTNIYSRAVEYKIDRNAMTVQQLWSYGKARGMETFSRIVSDVDYIPANDHFIFSPGASLNPANYGKVIEVDKSSQAVLFEATIVPPSGTTISITFHRTERLMLYR